MKRLLIDVNSAVPYFVKGTVNGIGRATIELVRVLSKIDNLPFEVMLYSQNIKGVGFDATTPFRQKHLYLRNNATWNRCLAKWPIREWLTGYDLMHIPHNFEYVHRPERCIVTIHDALFMKMDDPVFDYSVIRQRVPELARRCRHIITCSDSSKRDIMETMDIPEEKITVVYWGYDKDIFRPLDDQDSLQQKIAKRFGVQRPYLFTLSCQAKRKRADVLLECFIDYCAKGDCPFDLVMLWSNPPARLLQLAEARKVSDRLHFIKNVGDEELTMLYNGATAMFFPSQYEGFGRPLMEAMACGTTVVTCRNSSLEEIAGDAAIYLDEPVSESIPIVMSGLAEGKYPIAELRHKGLRRAQTFSWERFAKQMVTVYKQCLDL